MPDSYLQGFYKDIRKTIKEASEDVADFFKDNKKATLVVIAVYLFWKWFIQEEEEDDEDDEE